ncbi:transposable element Tc1 transposase [Trichonephila clavipes]|nr:transposable element Tc1 transposase [Trichonephila clavipes]
MSYFLQPGSVAATKASRRYLSTTKKCLAAGFELITSNRQFERGRIIGLKEAGWANRRIARLTGRNDVVIRRCWQEWVDNGRFQRHDGSGRSRATADRKDRLSDQLSQLLIHHNQPSDWCLVLSCWNHADYGRIVLSDEFRFQLCPDDYRRRVWRWPSQKADPAFNIACYTGPQLEVMIWGAISFDSWIPLVVIRDILTTQRYVDSILRTALLPFLLQYSGLIFQQDNARPHTERFVMNCLTAYQTLPWPARSPVLSPIEMSGI